MRILTLIHQFPPESFGGAEIYAFRLNHVLLARGHQLGVLYTVQDTRRSNYLLSEHRFAGFDIFQINRRRGHGHGLKSLWRLLYRSEALYCDTRIDRLVAQVTERFRPDVVHIHHLSSLSLGVIQQFKSRKIPVVMTAHDSWLVCWNGAKMGEGQRICESLPDCGASCLRHFVQCRINPAGKTCGSEAAMRWRSVLGVVLSLYLKGVESSLERLTAKRREVVLSALNQVEMILSPSIFLRKQYLGLGVDPARICHSPHGMVVCERKPVMKKENFDSIRFGYLGRWSPEKGLHVLLKAFSYLEPSAKLIVYGSDVKDHNWYTAYIRKLITHPGIQVRGVFDPRNIREVFEDVDVVIVPSMCAENSPVVIHEAFMVGVPVVAAAVGGVPELIQHGRNGFLFPMGDIKALHTCMQKFLENPGLVSQFSSHAHPIRSIEDDAQSLERLCVSLVGCGDRISRVSSAVIS